MKSKLKTLTTNFIARCILVMMLALFSVQGVRAQLSYSPPYFGTGNKATIDGVKVTRRFVGSAIDLAPLNTITSANGYCNTVNTPAPYARINPTPKGVNLVVYYFNEPVKEVYVDLIGLGKKTDTSKKGRVSFGIFCGTGTTAPLTVTNEGFIGCNRAPLNVYSPGTIHAYVEGTKQSNYRVKVVSADSEPFSILAIAQPANNLDEFVLVELRIYL